MPLPRVLLLRQESETCMQSRVLSTLHRVMTMDMSDDYEDKGREEKEEKDDDSADDECDSDEDGNSN